MRLISRKCLECQAEFVYIEEMGIQTIGNVRALIDFECEVLEHKNECLKVATERLNQYTLYIQDILDGKIEKGYDSDAI